MRGATKNATNSAANGSRREVGEDVIAIRPATMGATHACVAPTIVNNNPETMGLTRRSLPTPRGCVPDADAATLMCGRKFGEYSFLEDSRYTSQQEICGP